MSRPGWALMAGLLMIGWTICAMLAAVTLGVEWTVGVVGNLVALAVFLVAVLMMYLVMGCDDD